MVNPPASSRLPLALFGAFDRHNFGDLLFPHIAAALLPGRRLIAVGLAERDMRPWGGHHVRSLARLARQYARRPLVLLHAGGELLDCSAWEAAVMLLSADAAACAIRRLDADPEGRSTWARSVLGIGGEAPYALDPGDLPEAKGIFYQAVGGVGLDARSPAMRADVLNKLRVANGLSVRDDRTRAWLADAGLTARLVPDPAVMTAELFGERIRRRARGGEVARLRSAFPQGYIAVQFSAEFGDDATLDALTSQLERVARESGMGLVLFRAGAAPWHDDVAVLRRAASRLRCASHVFGSLHLWDICALIAHAAAYGGSSLHGGIVAMAFGLPHVNLLTARQAGEAGAKTKQGAYAQAWKLPGAPGLAGIDELAGAMLQAMRLNPAALRAHAADLAARYQRDFAVLAQALAGLGI